MDDNRLYLELLSVGRHKGIDFTRDDLEEVARNARALAPYLRPAVWVGHSDEEEGLAEAMSEKPSLGYLDPTSLRVVGDKLVGEAVNVPRLLCEAVARKLFSRASVELYRNWHLLPEECRLKTGVRGKALSGVALLGKSHPAIKELRDVRAILSAERPHMLEVDAPPPLVAGALRMHETDGERPKTMAERIEELDAQLTNLQESYRDLGTRTGGLLVRLGGLENPAAGRISEMVVSITDSVEAYVSLYRLDRHNPDDVARALQAVMRERPDDAQQLTAQDKEAIVSHFAKNPEVDPQSDAVRWWQREDPPEPRVPHTGHLPGIDEKLKFCEQAGTLYGTPHSEALTLGGGELAEGTRRYHRLRAIAESRGLVLSRSADRDMAERLLFDEIGSTVHTARTYDEAARALARRDGKVLLSEQDKRDVALRLAELRPDLVQSDYGSKDRRPVVQKREPLDAVRLTEMAREECRDQDVPLTPENLYKAKVALADKYGGPMYGSRRRD
jgi:hypothetical protein